MKTKLTKIINAIIANYGKTKIVSIHDKEINISMDEPNLSDAEMSEMVGEIEEAVPAGVTVTEEEGSIIGLAWS